MGGRIVPSARRKNTREFAGLVPSATLLVGLWLISKKNEQGEKGGKNPAGKIFAEKGGLVPGAQTDYENAGWCQLKGGEAGVVWGQRKGTNRKRKTIGREKGHSGAGVLFPSKKMRKTKKKQRGPWLH